MHTIPVELFLPSKSLRIGPLRNHIGCYLSCAGRAHTVSVCERTIKNNLSSSMPSVKQNTRGIDSIWSMLIWADEVRSTRYTRRKKERQSRVEHSHPYLSPCFVRVLSPSFLQNLVAIAHDGNQRIQSDED